MLQDIRKYQNQAKHSNTRQTFKDKIFKEPIRDNREYF